MNGRVRLGVQFLMEEVLEHHKKQEVCYTRPTYREARWERAVKVSRCARRFVYWSKLRRNEALILALMRLKSFLSTYNFTFSLGIHNKSGEQIPLSTKCPRTWCSQRRLGTFLSLWRH